MTTETVNSPIHDGINTGLPTAISNRKRLQPAPGDAFYLCHKDLLEGLTMALRGVSGAWLDFGCGGSPYRPLMATVSRYVRADVDGYDLDIVVKPGQQLPLEPASIDGVLSTQVLEHVEDVDWYLRECARVLRPGGKLVLSTHGVWADHLWPSDYRRWTGVGLREEVTRHGFSVRRQLALTNGLRAVVTLFELSGRTPVRGRTRLLRIPLYLMWGGYLVLRRFVNRYLDWSTRAEAVVPYASAGTMENQLYLVLLVEAIKAGTSPGAASGHAP